MEFKDHKFKGKHRLKSGRYSNRMEFKGRNRKNRFSDKRVDIATEWNLKFFLRHFLSFLNL